MTRFRLFMDEESMAAGLAQGLRRRGVSVLTVNEVSSNSLKDEAQLEFATANGLVLYSNNMSDFMALHTRWLESGRSDAGRIPEPWDRHPLRQL